MNRPSTGSGNRETAVPLRFAAALATGKPCERGCKHRPANECRGSADMSMAQRVRQRQCPYDLRQFSKPCGRGCKPPPANECRGSADMSMVQRARQRQCPYCLGCKPSGKEVLYSCLAKKKPTRPGNALKDRPRCPEAILCQVPLLNRPTPLS